MNHVHARLTYPGRYDNVLQEKIRKTTKDYFIRDNMSILDIGCSVGVEITRLAIENPHHNFTGLDAMAENIEKAKSGVWSIPGDVLTWYNSRWNADSCSTAFTLIEKESQRKLQREFDSDCYPLLQARAIELPNVDFVVGDYNQIPIKNKQFDLITAFYCRYNPQEHLEDLDRILRHDGILLTQKCQAHKYENGIIIKEHNEEPVKHELTPQSL